MKLRFEIKITSLYLILGGLWIIFSDRLLLTITQNKEAMSHLQTYKGWFFVLITGLFFFVFVRKQLKKLEHSEKKLASTNQQISKQNKILSNKNLTIEQINVQLKISRDRAIESDRLKTAFMENMSHEIRTPLNSIVGFSELVSDGAASDSEKKEYSVIIQKNSHQLLQIIHDILDISSLNTNQTRLQIRPVDLHALITNSYTNWLKEAQEKGLTFPKPTISGSLSHLIMADQQILTKILNNLISNAIKFTQEGSIELRIKLDDSGSQISVTDSGMGILPEDQHKIFEPFFQANRDPKTVNDGTGLGLSITKGFVELMDGTISLVSESGKGSTFIIEIPNIPPQSKVSSDHQIVQKESFDWSQKKILIVEDEVNNYIYLQEILKRFNPVLYHATNGAEAVSFIKTHKGIDLVLMDIKMPVLNGYDATRIIKQLCPEIPVIAQTAYSLPEDKEKAISAGCCEFISKPLTRDDLLKTIKEHIS